MTQWGLELWILIWSPGFESLSDLCWVTAHTDVLLTRHAILPNEREEGTRDEDLRMSAWEATC